MLHTRATPCLFVQMVRERQTFKNMSGTLSVLWLLLNTLFGLFCGSLTCKYVTPVYVAAVKPLNRPDTVCLLVYKCRKSQPYLSSIHVAFKNLNQTFFLASKNLLNTLPQPQFMHFNLKDIKHTLFPEPQTPKASVVLVSCFSFDWLPYLRFILRFLNAKYMRCTFILHFQPLKTAFLSFFKHFHI